MVIHGDLFDVLPTLDADRFHACITDPPYGIGFLGREWDTFNPAVAEKKQGLRQIDKSEAWRPHDKRVINPNLKGRTVNGAISSSQIEYDRTLAGQQRFQVWTEAWAREVLRVLKPGAHLVVCGAPRSHHRMFCGIEDAGFEIRDCLVWLFGQGFPKSKNLGHGWGTALKPGHEPILLARKPFATSTQHCHDTRGTGGLHIDACRIDGPGWTKQDGDTGAGFKSGKFMGVAGRGDPTQCGGFRSSDLGRWPANVLLDEEAAALLDDQSGEWRAAPRGPQRGAMGYRQGTTAYADSEGVRGPGDFGGASRFFYVAKPSRQEREIGLFENTRCNIHPTVKPLALMRWLVRLVTPVGGSVLDPFGGSGTTAMACAAEGVDFVLLEREAEYVPILEARIRAIAPLFTEIL